jgi:hypothetical protein
VRLVRELAYDEPVAVENLDASRRYTLRRARSLPLPWQGMLGLGLWLVGALGLSVVAGRVTDWFDMTDEMRYERLAISIARTGSLVPRIHGVGVKDLDQLYPLLIAMVFRHGAVAQDIHRAHVLGAWMMSSACIPAFLLARRVSGRDWVAWVVAAGSVTVPWLIYSSFLLTEVVAYPVFLWAVFAVERTVAAPSIRADLAAVVALVVAFFARTEFLGLAVVLPLAVVVVELTAPSTGPWSERATASLRRCLVAHRVLVVVYGCLLVSLVAYVAAGGHPLGLSAYGQEVPTSLVPRGFAAALVGYVAQVAFGLGLLPFIVGFAWLIANTIAPGVRREAHAFACVGSLSFAFLTVEVAKYAVGVGNVIYERFLFYFSPIMLLAFILALVDRRWPRWSLLVPLALVCAGFAFRLQDSFTWAGARVNADTPLSIFYHPLIEVAGSRAALQVGLICAAVLLTGLFALAAVRVPNRKVLAAVLVALAVGLSASETAYVYARLFRTSGYSGRPLTAPVPSTLDWVDGVVGQNADVTVIPFHVSTDYWVNLQYWRDIEFWNKSVDRAAEFPNAAPYDFTGIWFPKLGLAFDQNSGRANVSPTRYVVQSIGDSRFQIAGNVQSLNQYAQLIDADHPWRAAFLTLGTYDDGWLKPNTQATIRVFPVPGQRGPRILSLTLQIWAPTNIVNRPFSIRSNADRYRGVASNSRTTFVNSFLVCVPPGGHADVSIRATGASTIPGDLSSLQGSLGQRLGSIYIADASVSNNIGSRCTVGQARNA